MADEVAKPKGGGVLLPALLITVIAAAGGGAFGTLVLGGMYPAGSSETSAAKQKPKDKKGASAKNKKHGKQKKKGGKEAASAEVSDHEVIIQLAPVLTNLHGQSKQWVRLEASIIAKAGTKPIEQITQKRLAQDIMAHLRQTRLEEFEGAAGLINLRSDLSEIVRIRTKGRSQELVVHGMVVE